MSITQLYADWQKNHSQQTEPKSLYQNGVWDFEPQSQPTTPPSTSPRDPIYDCPRNISQMYATWQKYHHQPPTTPKQQDQLPSLAALRSHSSRRNGDFHSVDMKYSGTSASPRESPGDSEDLSSVVSVVDEGTRDVERMYENWRWKRELQSELKRKQEREQEHDMEREREERKSGDVYEYYRSENGAWELRVKGKAGLKKEEEESMSDWTFLRDILEMYDLWQRNHGDEDAGKESDWVLVEACS